MSVENLNCESSKTPNKIIGPNHQKTIVLDDSDNANIISKGLNNDTETEKGMCLSFEDAMNLTGFGKFNIATTLFIGSITLGLILENLGFGYVIPACQCDLELTLTQKGWLAAIPFSGMTLMSHGWGYLTDTYGRKKISMITMTLGSCFSIISSFSPNLATFAVLRFITGLFITGPASMACAYLGEMNPAKYRDTVITLSSSFVAFASAVIPLLAWAVLPTDFHIDVGFLPFGYRPWRLLVSLFALPYVFCVIVFYFYFPESAKFLISKGKSKEALEILKKIYKYNSGRPSEEFPVTDIILEKECINLRSDKTIFQDIRDQTVPLFKKPHLRYMITCLLLQFNTFAIVNGFYIWFPDILNHILNQETFNEGVSTNLCGILYKDTTSSNTTFENITTSKCDDSLHTRTFPISILLSCIVAILIIGTALLVKRINKRTVLITMYLIAATSVLTINWITNVTIGLIAFSVLQICEVCIGLVNAFVTEIFPTNYRAMAASLVIMAGGMGSMFGTNTLGYLVNANCDLCFYLFAIFTYYTVVLCFFLPKTSQSITGISKTNLQTEEIKEMTTLM